MPNPRRKKYDIQFFKEFPGIFICLQWLFCSLGFLVCAFDNYTSKPAKVLYLITMAVAMFLTKVWILINFCEVKHSKQFRKINWNKLGMYHSSFNGFFSLIMSSYILDYNFVTKSLKAAAVLGFFGFTAFFVHFCWEFIRFRKTSVPMSEATTISASGTEKRFKSADDGSESDDCEDPITDGIEGTISMHPTSVKLLPIAKNDVSGSVALKQNSKTQRAEDNEDSFDSDESEPTEVKLVNNKN